MWLAADMTMRSRWPMALWIVSALLVLVTGALLARVGFLNEIPSHTEDAGKILSGAVDPAATYRLPLGYAGLLAAFVTALPQAAAVKALNFAGYLAFLAGAWWWVVRGGGRRDEFARLGPLLAPAAAVVLAGAVLVHPCVMLSLSRTNESIVAGALLMALVVLTTGRRTLATAAAAGLVLGLFLHVRANSGSLLLPIAVWLVFRGGEEGARRWRNAGTAGAVLLGAAAALFALFSLAVSGTPNYRPTNGGYNVFAATNPYSWDEIVRNQNAEYALRPALRDHGIRFEDRNSVPEAQYMAWAKDYAASHPVEMAKLTALKGVTFLSPRLANAHSPAKVLVQFAAAALFWIALGWTAVCFGRRRRWADGILLLIAASYAAPFVLTNADPRMRFPLDMVFLVQLVALVAATLIIRTKVGGPTRI